MIEQNYYQGFQRLCDRNEKMARIPTKDELEKMGCEVSGMCYLITKDGKQYNPATVNPEIMDDHIRMMFTSPVLPAPVLVPTPYRPKPIEVPKMAHAEKDSPIGKVCTQCGSGKPIEQFGRKAGRGDHRKDICIECESKNKEVAINTIVEPKKQIQEDSGKFVSIDRVKALVLEAYEIGKKEGQSEVTIIEPTINEILGEQYGNKTTASA